MTEELRRKTITVRRRTESARINGYFLCLKTFAIDGVVSIVDEDGADVAIDGRDRYEGENAVNLYSK